MAFLEMRFGQNNGERGVAVKQDDFRIELLCQFNGILGGAHGMF